MVARGTMVSFSYSVKMTCIVTIDIENHEFISHDMPNASKLFCLNRSARGFISLNIWFEFFVAATAGAQLWTREIAW